MGARNYDLVFNHEIDLESYLIDLVKTRRKKAYFFVCTINGDGTGWDQKSFHKSELDKALQYIRKNKNKRIFVPTMLFDSRNRLEENIGQIRKIIIDLDIYKSEKHKDRQLEEVVQEITEKYFDTNKIPTSNAITYSGGGLYLEWEFQYTPGGNVLQKRRVVAKILYEMLKEYGPDAKCLDAVHVFGLAGTINWKYGNDSVVRTFKNDLPPYTLSEVARNLPSLWDVWQIQEKIQTKKEKKPTKKQMAAILPIHKERTLAHDHIVTIKQLIQVRNGDMDGYREMALFFVRNAYHKMHTKRFSEGDETLYLESYKLACEVNGMFTNPLKDAEIRKNTLNTKKLYRFKTETIVDKFDITLDEQIKLKVKTKDAKREKSKRQMRELRGSKGSREEYNQERKNDKEHLLDMLRRLLEKNPKAKNKDLAGLLGVTPQWISQLKKEL
ncbi:replication protein (plasmid) [Neobacillus niacini]|uniref:replication protein n=1 Tax=Neobacillus niacini TaxID=86668 RepID=UPI003B017FF2